MGLKNYYQTLGVAEDADNKAVKAAYRKLASKYHPDVSEHDYAEEMFMAAGEAYEVLKDTKKRAEYDDLWSYGAQGQNFTPSPDWKHAGGLGGEHRNSERSFSDFFRAIFAGDSNSYSTRRDREQSFWQCGQDVQIDMPIFLSDTLQETLEPISYHFNGEDKNLKVKIPAGVQKANKFV